ncbi:cupin domain-containing protein [Leptolyngbya sp. KIOST-1]|uniref:cupin domain-containing protein n=1 Tax=Leptolyngbya sp. KIOST-1 TaxID=1229172 RepID=UPI00056B63B5|nr:cupin domain-containing protein [Leptolyngbya sp. KIOST-1]
MARPHPLLTAAAISAMAESTFTHPLNPRAIRHGRSLGDAIAFEYIGVHLVRVEPGHDSTQYHRHQAEEEFIYILSGRGLAEIGDETFEVGPGDFMGFVAGGLAHSLSNPFGEDLVYLVGGMRLEFDICDYPKVNTRLYRRGEQREYVELGE